jgi:hypothetical protein
VQHYKLRKGGVDRRRFWKWEQWCTKEGYFIAHHENLLFVMWNDELMFLFEFI